MKARVLTLNTLFQGNSRARLGVLAGILERPTTTWSVSRRSYRR